MHARFVTRVEGDQDSRTPDPGAIRQALEVLMAPDQHFQIFCLPAARGVWHVASDLDAALLTVASMGDQAGIYYTLHCMRPGAKVARACDALARRWLLVDSDPVRAVPDSSATDEEKAAACTVAMAVHDDLAARSWPAPIIIDSGNGWHLLYRIDMPADKFSQQLVKHVLETLGARHDTAAAKVDRSVHDAARKSKLPGTWARKGPDTPERPHRLAKLVFVPETLAIVGADQLQALIDQPGECVSRGAFLTEVPPEPNRLEVYLARAIEAEVARVLLAPVGERNNMLNRAAFSLGQLVSAGLSLDDLRQRLIAAAARCGLTGLEIARTIESGLTAGQAQPRGLPSSVLNGATANGKTTIETEIELPIVLPSWPDPLGEAAYYGLVGDVVREIEPHTEADPAAILMQLIVAYGNLIGRAAFARVGPAFHHANEYVLIIGDSSAGRKGMAWDEVVRLLGPIDPDWMDRVGGGLSTGEGLIYHVRDPLEGREAVKQQGRVVDYQDVILDQGVSDKRLMIIETEFARSLQAMRREGSTLSAVIRQGWDGHRLATRTRSFPFVATGAHVSIIGHITANELCRLLSNTDLSNGFANRFLWIASRRARLLPRGGNLADDRIASIQDRLCQAVAFGQAARQVTWSVDALRIWDETYARLTKSRPGSVGQVVNRAEAHALRLAMLTALINQEPIILPDHVRAALAMVAYSERSASYILGDRLDDRDEESILLYLRARLAGASRSEIRRGVFNDNKPAIFVMQKLASLLRQGLIRSELQPTSGRPREVFWASYVNVKNVERGAYHAFHVHVEAESDAESAMSQRFPRPDGYPADWQFFDGRGKDAP